MLKRYKIPNTKVIFKLVSNFDGEKFLQPLTDENGEALPIGSAIRIPLGTFNLEMMEKL